MKHYYQTTDYPKIYKGSYWGSHETCISSNGIKDPTQDIIQNRNDFIKQFQIIKYKQVTYRQWERMHHHHRRRDHQEHYEDVYGRIIYVCSQYEPYPLYKQMKPIYSPGQWSGYQIAETIKSKKILIDTIFSKLPPDISKYILTFMKPIKYRSNTL
jgi:hypothetical protein